MSLSAREKEVVDLVVRGLSNHEIGRALFVTEKTVKFHLTNIFKSKGVTSWAQLIIKHLREDVSQSEINAFKAILK